MAIKQTIADEYHFWEWLRNSDNYSKNFSIDGAKAVQAYYDGLSEELGTDILGDIEFDPIAWCCEWAEYDNIGEAYEAYFGNYDDVKDQNQGNRTPEQQLERFQDNTQVIELDNGHVLVQEF